MAKEPEKSAEIVLKAIDAAIASLRAQDWDLNPYSVAAAAELAPEAVFSNKLAMDKIMDARGDGSTYSYDSELGGRCKELTAELENATVINQDLYDRGSELAERVVELEANISELEQEAETLALQLQNSWSLGYQKGLAEGKEKALAEAEGIEKSSKQKTGSQKEQSQTIPPTEISKTAKASIRSEEQSTGSITDEDLPIAESLHQAEAREPEVKPAIVEPQALPKEQRGADHSEPALPAQQPTPAKAVGYNDQSFNAVSDHRPPINVSEVYGALSWKQIETVYQYSTVAGRPNTNLYFEPLSPPDVDEFVDVAHTAAAPPTPTPTVPAAAEPARSRKKSNMPDISFDPPEEPIVSSNATSESTASSAPKSVDKPAVSAADVYQLDYVNQYDGGLTGENYPTLAEMQKSSNGKNEGRQANATFDKLDALPAGDDEIPDILDLDKLDIFEGLEDMDELSHIEVIEDVIITPVNSQNERIASQSETSAMPKVSNEDLRDLIKTRIKQAQDNDPSQVGSFDQLMDAAIASGGDAGSAAAYGDAVGDSQTSGASGSPTASDGETGASAAIDLEAIRQGVRNKFVGGKTPAAAPAGGPVGEATNQMPPISTIPTPRVAPVPADIRKHCMILGVRPEELTSKIIIEAWKAQIAAPGVHPDQGGDTETAVYLNLAKDTLIKWVEAQAPKLGKKFGQQSQARDSQSKPFTMRQGPDKDTDKK